MVCRWLRQAALRLLPCNFWWAAALFRRRRRDWVGVSRIWVPSCRADGAGSGVAVAVVDVAAVAVVGVAAVAVVAVVVGDDVADGVAAAVAERGGDRAVPTAE